MTKCLECDAVALFMHREDGTTIYTCAKHRCFECDFIKNDSVSEQGQFLDAWFCGKHVSSDSPDTCVVCLEAEVESLRAQVKVLEACAESEATRGNEYEAQVQAVRELHHSKLDRHPQGDVQRCIACLDLWPCPTVKALDGEL